METMITSVTNENIVTISSREVAEMMEVRHDSLIRKIKTISETFGSDMNDYWIKSSYKDKKNKARLEYKITYKGIQLIIQHSRKTPQLQNLIEQFGEGDYKLINRFELAFKECLIQTLIPFGIEVEFQKPCLDYRIDFYIPEYKIAIEYDEEGHKYQIDQDNQRQKEIEKELNCKFIRLNYRNHDCYNIGLVLKELIERGLK